MPLAALALAGCVATDVPRQHVPRRLVVNAGEALPDDLRADADPEVVVLLLISGDNRSAAVEAVVDRLQDAMQERGFDWGRHVPLGCLGCYEMRFFGKRCSVFETTAVAECCRASQVLFESAIPFDWDMSQGFYLCVPAAFANAARALLRADGRVHAAGILGGDD